MLHYARSAGSDQARRRLPRRRRGQRPPCPPAGTTQPGGRGRTRPTGPLVRRVDGVAVPEFAIRPMTAADAHAIATRPQRAAELTRATELRGAAACLAVA